MLNAVLYNLLNEIVYKFVTREWVCRM